MPLTNFPHGISSFGVPVLGGSFTTTGRVFFLDDSVAMSSDSVMQGTSPDLPFDTYAFAYAQAATNRGDVILVGPGHSQAASVGQALTTKAGVTFALIGSGVSWTTNATGGSSFNANVRGIIKAAAVLADTTVVFTVTGGPIQVHSLVSVCVTANGAGATTLRWNHDPTDGAAATFTGATATLANAAAGATVVVVGTALTTAPVLVANGGTLAQTTSIILPAGVVSTTVATGPSTGTWSHHMLYRPMAPGVVVT